MFNTIHDLYVSPEFKKLRAYLMNERTSEDGLLHCEYCHGAIVRPYDCIAHHKIEVTLNNLHDTSITLNPENIMLVHHSCHNAIHNRFGRAIQKIYFVWGSPRSGKTTYVNEVKGYNDLVVDIDSIWQCIGDRDLNKPSSLKPVVFSLRDRLYENILMRLGSWSNAYIITTKLDNRLVNKLGGETIYIPSTMEECLERCENEAWKRYVNDWWDNPPLEAQNYF